MPKAGRRSGAGRYEVFRILRDKILYLEYKPGTPLNEGALSEELAAGRTPIREAILLLEREGLIEIFPQSGTFVTLIDLAVIRDSAYMRHVVERTVIEELAAQKCQLGPHVERFLLLQDLAVRQNDAQEYVRNDHLLHSELFALCGRRGVWQALERQYLHTIRYNMVDFQSHPKLEESLEEHREIVRCVESGDLPKLQKVLAVHHDADLASAEMYLKTFGEYFRKETGEGRAG